ncbi:MAG: sigma 54-interacting transcriptional regulator, partial [Myxococcota bacterium]
AVEDQRFLRIGDDEQRQSDFQLIAGTNRDLRKAVAARTFREDLLARIDLWHFHLPSLAERRQDIGPNLDFELARFSERSGRRVRFRPEARRRLMVFAESERASWSNNFRDLSACATRLATFATGGFIETHHVDDEVARLEERWSKPRGGPRGSNAELEALGVEAAELDEFDRVQLTHVIEVCRQSPSIAAAGRRLFAVSRSKKARPNDADRLRKYLARFSIDAASLVG